MLQAILLLTYQNHYSLMSHISFRLITKYRAKLPFLFITAKCRSQEFTSSRHELHFLSTNNYKTRAIKMQTLCRY